MRKIKIFDKSINSLESGKFFKVLYSIMFKVIAVLFALSSIFTIINSWKLTKYLNTTGFIGLILAELVMVIGVIIIIIIVWKRANELIDIRESRYTILAIVSHLFKSIGEVGLIFVNISSISSAITIWFAVGYLNDILDKLIKRFPLAAYLKYISDSGIAAGVLLIIGSFFYSLFVLILFYFWAYIIDGFKVLVENSEATKIRLSKK